MDCRTIRRLLGPGLALALACGCSHFDLLPSKATPQEKAAADAKKAAEARAEAEMNAATKKEDESLKPLRRAATCAAFGNFHAKKAQAVGLPLSEKEQLRNEARACFGQALTHDPNCLTAYHGLGELYQDMERFADAAAVYQEGA